MTNELTKFEFQSHEVRVTTDEHGEPWFIAKDVCYVLGIADSTTATRDLDPDELSSIVCVSGGQHRKMTTVSESGLYALVFKSRKPEAKKFRKWITSEVIPAIRKTGGYMVAKPDETPEEIMARAVLIAQDTINRLKNENDKLKQDNFNKGLAIAHNRPKVTFADAVSASHSSILVGDLARILKQNGVNTGQNRLFEWLRDNGWLVKKRRADYNMPTQKSMEAGLFEIKENVVNNKDGSVRITRTPRITGAGQIFFINQFLQKDED